MPLEPPLFMQYYKANRGKDLEKAKAELKKAKVAKVITLDWYHIFLTNWLNVYTYLTEYCKYFLIARNPPLDKKCDYPFEQWSNVNMFKLE